MAVRFNLRQTELTRAKIQASQLVNTLQANVLGRRVRKDGRVTIEKDFLSAEQVRSACALLDKYLPTLGRTEIAGDEKAQPVRIVVEGVAAGAR